MTARPAVRCISAALASAALVSAALASAALAAVASLAPVRPAWATTDPLANPPGNRPLPALAGNTGLCVRGKQAWRCQSPCFPTGLTRYNDSRACVDLVLAAINKAQSSEHLNGFTLPSNYFDLAPTRQLLVLVNLERISRSVPPLVGLSPYLSAAATSAARQGEDPEFQVAYGPVRVWSPPGGGLYAFGGAWSGNDVNAAVAVFGWFYDDGWGGKGNTSNFACTSASAPGCWGHRDELLGEWAGTGCTDCLAGAGYAAPAARGWQESYDFLLVRPVHYPSALAFSWDGGVVPYLPSGWERAHAPT